MRPDAMQNRGREIAKALWFDEDIPFDGYVIRPIEGVTSFTVFLLHRNGRALAIARAVVPGDPVKVIAQALATEARKALR